MDPKLRQQIALMVGQQAIEVVDHLLTIEQLQAELDELRQAKAEIENHRDQLETALARAEREIERYAAEFRDAATS